MDATRPAFYRAPFSQGEFTYATNGSLVVRVDRVAGVEEIEGAPTMAPIFKIAFDRARKSRFVPMPAIAPESATEGLAPVVIGPGSFQARLLRLFAGLPGVLIAPGEDDLSPCRIRFDGGLATLMPLRLEDGQ